MSYSSRSIQVELSPDNMAFLLEEIMRQIAPGTIKKDEYISTMEFLHPVESSNIKLQLKLIKEEVSLVTK